MIKIEDTYKEEENPQETMATSMEEPMAQRILMALDKHGEVLKKMGGRLTRLEESKLKKSTHVEIHDDEKMKNGTKKTKWSMKETSNLRSLL